VLPRAEPRNLALEIGKQLYFSLPVAPWDDRFSYLIFFTCCLEFLGLTYKKPMRISLRLIVSLIVGVTLLSAVFAIFQQRAEKRGLRNDLAKRAQILAESLGANVEPLLGKGARSHLQKIVIQFGNSERVTGIAVFDSALASLRMGTSGSASFQSARKS